MPKQKKKRNPPVGPEAPQNKREAAEDEIDFPTVVWSLVILAVLVILHRLIWGG